MATNLIDHKEDIEPPEDWRIVVENEHWIALMSADDSGHIDVSDTGEGTYKVELAEGDEPGYLDVVQQGYATELDEVNKLLDEFAQQYEEE